MCKHISLSIQHCATQRLSTVLKIGIFRHSDDNTRTSCIHTYRHLKDQGGWGSWCCFLKFYKLTAECINKCLYNSQLACGSVAVLLRRKPNINWISLPIISTTSIVNRSGFKAIGGFLLKTINRFSILNHNLCNYNFPSLFLIVYNAMSVEGLRLLKEIS